MHNIRKKITQTLLFTAMSVGFASATTLTVDVELPKYADGNNHRPYVAAWLEHDKKLIEHLFVWYKYDHEDKEEGLEWLKDLRQWWRKGGRKLDNPVDGLAGATRKPGKHSVTFDDESKVVKALKQGDKYVLRVEVLREEAGREVINLPFTYDGAETISVSDKGKVEVGEVTLNIKPSEEK